MRIEHLKQVNFQEVGNLLCIAPNTWFVKVAIWRQKIKKWLTKITF